LSDFVPHFVAHFFSQGSEPATLALILRSISICLCLDQECSLYAQIQKDRPFGRMAVDCLRSILESAFTLASADSIPQFPLATVHDFGQRT